MPRANERIGPYQLIRKLGAGGFGEVWLARNVQALYAPEVALKLPTSDTIDLAAIHREASIWVQANGHPNVLPMIEASIYDNRAVIVSEFASDGSLEGWLEHHGNQAVPVNQAVEWTRGVLSGLAYLHARKIVHRDLKLANVLLQCATPRIADFGISRLLRTNNVSTSVIGTPFYMAPEAFWGRRDQQTDLWAVGVILYQLLCGHLPFEGRYVPEIQHRISNEEPPPVPHTVPAWLRAVVKRALAKNPDVRFATAEEMRAALVEPHITPPQPQPAPQPDPPVYFVTPETVPRPHQPRPVTVPQPQPLQPTIPVIPAVRRSRALLAGLVVTGLIMLTGIGYWIRQTTTRQEFTEIINGVKMEMVLVPGGSFMMSSPASEQGRDEDEGPQHKVTVPSFYIGKYEVTQAQWKALMGNYNPSRFTGDELPVERVSWNAANEFCEKLSHATNKTYRLPSEAEWEYACRAKTTGAYAGNFNSMAWYDITSGDKTHPVGRKQPNAFGLYDMHGNVSEWCEDVYHNSYGGEHGTPPSDGSAWLTGGEKPLRVVRGGAWSSNSGGCRSASRSSFPGNSLRDDWLGLRVVVSAKTQ